MRIKTFTSDPIATFPYLNAGRRPNQFFEDTLAVYHGRVTQLPADFEFVLATSDLQGREPLDPHPTQPPRLLGEVLPDLLAETLAGFSVSPARGLCLLAGDFYTYEDLRGRGGTGDVTRVWQRMAENYGHVVGVAGNHDMFGPEPSRLPRMQPPAWILDNAKIQIAGLRISGLSGIMGNPQKNFRRSRTCYLDQLAELLQRPTDLLLMHDGPNAPSIRGKGSMEVREIIEQARPSPSLVIRGHSHWSTPFVELESGIQVLNVDASVAILTR